MKHFVATVWGLLWHKLEIGLMRVGEPINGVIKNFLGVIDKILTLKAAKIIDHIFYSRVRYTLYIHACNELGHGTPGRQ